MSIHIHIHHHNSEELKALCTLVTQLKDTIMATAQEFQAGFDRIDAATNQLAEILRNVANQIGSMTKEEEDAAKAKLESVASVLEAMAATPTDPVPVPVP